MNTESKQSKIKITMNGGGKPVAIVIYKGKQLCRSPVNLSIKTIMSQKPKRQDKTFAERMAKWESLLCRIIAHQVLDTFAETLFKDELNSNTLVEINWEQVA